MNWATRSAAWRRAYARAYVDTKGLPFLVRLTPVTLLYIAYKQIRYTPEEFRNARKTT
ncbi:MAG: hypothetical protein M3P11_11260 [Actinomycetota bacterium]|nr:hypothetical protein [Actinomycetota bacterium]